MAWNFRRYSTGHAAVHSKHRKFTHPNEQFYQYIFVLSRSTFMMTALMLWTSNTMIDIN